MPVPTETLYKTRTLNVLFAASALLLLVSTAWLVVADYTKAWHGFQLEARRWDAAMTVDAVKTAQDNAQRQGLGDLQARISRLEEALPHQTLRQYEADLERLTDDQKRGELKLATIKGEISPKEQQIERAILRHGEDSQQVVDLRRELAAIMARFTTQDAAMAGIGRQLAETGAAIRALNEDVDEQRKAIDALKRDQLAAEEKLQQLQPTGPAWLVEQFRNAPLLDFFNPSLQPQQDVVPLVRTDYNFMTVETTDRCRSCHINIDDPRFEPATLDAFVERQVAQMENQDVNAVDRPVVLVEFWRDAAMQTNAATKLDAIDGAAIERINELREDADLDTLDDPSGLAGELRRIQLEEAGNDDQPRRRWYAQVNHYVADLKDLLHKQIGADQFKLLSKTYRTVLIERYNTLRAEADLSQLSTDPVLLAHPDLDLIAGLESPHPVKTMGCTVCHEGSGQETQFEHTAHTPREIWVDAETGAPVPQILIATTGTNVQVQATIRNASKQVVEAAQQPDHAGLSLPVLSAATIDDEHNAPGDGHDGHGATSHQDLNLNDPHDPAPFAPVQMDHAAAAAYHRPGDEPGALRMAVHQSQYWNHEYGWHVVHYMHWEKPMHSLDYVESSCAKCHTEIYDLKETAPSLFEGRMLYAQLGCANCHAVTDLEDALDVKRVGPDLTHVDKKLSAKMTANWVWAPRAFRPFARMPHYFMLENNSAPLDIERTRVEVAAMTHYLMNAKPAQNLIDQIEGEDGLLVQLKAAVTDARRQKLQAKIDLLREQIAITNDQAGAYDPAAAPKTPGDVEVGRELFASVGCLACHTNMAETGEAWIVGDLVDREELDSDEAQSRYEAMTYNQRHWYALEHLEDRIVQIGPELSAVGTKLKADRTEQQAHNWLYDWLVNPRHYSNYTIMPSFRLTEQEANDLTAYLLSMERPDDYQLAEFMDLDDRQKQILGELTARLTGGQNVTLQLARDLAAEKSVDEQLMFIGRKVISHYGCNGCHAVNGYETAASACTRLDDWGLKDPHKIDFGYFDHAFDERREQPIEVTKVKHEGLTADATQIAPDSDKIVQREVQWESIDAERRPWLYHKLHNPRLFDRGRSGFNGDLDTAQFRPYDKLKMPKFFVNDRQARALVTYVTSIRKPLVSPEIQRRTYSDARLRVAHGKQLATMYNCYGCHNIEANEVQLHQYYGVHNADGTYNDNGLNWAPPRLIGQGAKTQPGWLYNFLQNVVPIRPWLKVRMPSFPLDDDQPRVLVDYFAGHADELHDKLAAATQRIESFRQANPQMDWLNAEKIAADLEMVRHFAARADVLLNVRQLLDERYTPDRDELARNWEEAIGKVRMLGNVYETDYPYVHQPAPVDDARLARGQRLFFEMGCMTGECHRVGDEELLGEKGLLVVSAADMEDEWADDDDDDYDDDDDDDNDDYDDDDDDDDSGPGSGLVVGPAPLDTPPGGAPNLNLVAQRLQRDWVRRWVEHSRTIQPGTRMQEYFIDGQTFWQQSGFADDTVQEKNQLFGYTAADHRDLLLDFLYTVGPKRITVHPYDGTNMAGGPSEPVELEALAPPPDKPAPKEPDEGESPDMAEQPDAPDQPEAAAPVVAPAKSTIELHEGEQAWPSGGGDGKGRIVGVVNFDGKTPRRRPINMKADPNCAATHTNALPLDPTVIVNEDNTIRNVVVTVKSGLSGTFDAPTEPVVIDQVGCSYAPHIAVAMVGQPLLIKNSDKTLHNVNAKPKKNSPFNKGMGPGTNLTQTFRYAESSIPFKCDVHPWMGALLHVLDHPFAAVSDVEGRFEITGLPPGNYTFEAMHEDKKIGSVTFDVQVKADTSTRVDVTVQR